MRCKEVITGIYEVLLVIWKAKAFYTLVSWISVARVIVFASDGLAAGDTELSPDVSEVLSVESNN